MKLLTQLLFLLLVFVQCSGFVTADEPQPDATTTAEAVSAPDHGDVAWMLVASAFVLLMTCPGLALFYGGLVRKKNILGVMMQCVFLMGMMSVYWALFGYSWAFGGDGRWVGGFNHVFLKGVMPSAGLSPDAAANGMIFMIFQGMFFIITPALICGAFAERMKFTTMCVFSVLWATVVYCPLAHWVWHANGWLFDGNTDNQFRAIDFAGGTVVHISSGVSALVCALMICKRRGFGSEPMTPHNLTYTCIGAGLLWVGWFGFNGGSALAANGKAINAVVVTHFAAAAGVLGWSLCEFIKHGRASILGACSGAVAGLVCITPASGSVNPMSAMVMGLAGGMVCYLACTSVKNTFNYDDSLDAFGVHGVGGTLGALLTGVFATSAITGELGGVVDGNFRQLLPQAVSVIAAASLGAVGTALILKLLDATMGVRVSERDEIQGLDISQHGEEGYIFQ